MISQNQFMYLRERRRFGRQCLFGDRDELMVSVFPSLRKRIDFILRSPTVSSTQKSSQMALTIIKTPHLVQLEHGMLHFEGGWPRDINMLDDEQTLRYRKKIEREDNWGLQIIGLIKHAIDVCLQNAAVNIHQDFFTNFGSLTSAVFEARQYTVFRDPVYPHRAVANIDFAFSEKSFVLTVLCSQNKSLSIQTEVSPQENYSIFAIFYWDMSNSLKPMGIYNNNDMCCIANFCPKDPSYLAGGTYSGNVAVWDARNGGYPLQLSPLESAHRESVSALCWVHSKSNTEFYSGSFDGSIKIWDGRDLNKPLLELLLDQETSDDQLRSRSHGVCVLEFEYTIPVRFIAGSSHGHIFVGNRKGKVPSEILINNFKLCAGPIFTVERNPYFVKNFFITGYWNAKIWTEETKNAPHSLIFRKTSQVICGTWSTSRSSLFVIGDADGSLDFWDLLLSHRQPIYKMHYKQAVTSVKFRSDGSYLAIGLKNGETHIIQLEAAMKFASAKERLLTSAVS